MDNVSFGSFKTVFKEKLNILKERTSFACLDAEERSGILFFRTNIKLLPRTFANVPFKLGRSIRGLSFYDKLDQDPTGSMVKGVVEGASHTILVQQLKAYYLAQSTMTCSEIVQLPNNKTLREYPAWALSMPWEKISIEHKFNSYPSMLFRSRRQHSLSFLVEKNDEIMKVMHSEKGAKSQIQQTLNLLESVNSVGMLSNFKPPQIHILRKGNEWRWIMSGDGNHRAYLSFCIGMEHFRVEILDWIERDRVNDWYNVKNKVYSEQEALQLFDKVFEGASCLRGDV
jgi:hypothetical protein